MSAFLSSFASYLIEMIILIALALLGGFIGVKLRKRKDMKEGTSVSMESSKAPSEN